MIKMNLNELKQLQSTGLSLEDEFNTVAYELEGIINDSSDNIGSANLKSTLSELSANFWNYSVSIRNSLEAINMFLGYQVDNYIEINANTKEKVDNLVLKLDEMVGSTFGENGKLYSAVDSPKVSPVGSNINGNL